MDDETLRGRISDEIRAVERETFVELAHAIKNGGCWGAVADDVERICSETEDYLALLDVLVQFKDARALFLFLGAARSRPAIFEAMVRRADALPRVVQRALVSLPNFDDVPDAPRDTLCAAAREILGSPPARAEARLE